MALPGEVSISTPESTLAPDLTPEEQSLLEQAQQREAGIEQEEAPPDLPDQQPAEREPSAQRAPKGYVPTQTLKEARDEAARYRAELQQRRETDAALAERLRIFQEQRAIEEQVRQRQAQPPPPDPNEDPLGWQDYRTRQLEAELQALRQQHQQTAEVNNQTQQAIVLQRLQSEEAQLVQAHVRQQPGYQEDYQLVREAWADQFRAMGFTDEQVEWQLRQGQALISQACLGYRPDGSFGYVRNPGQSITEMAQKIRAARGMEQNGHAAPREQSSRLQQIRRGQAAASSLSSVGGQSGRMVNAQTLKNMSNSEFIKFYEENPEIVDKILAGLGE